MNGQERFINSRAIRIRCVAGPGTGKTWAMKRRIERLLKEDETVGSRIFAVTFTRNAAAQLKKDLTELDVSGAEDIKASTLHSYAFKNLRRESAIEALGRVPRPCFEFELYPFRHDLAEDFRSVRNVREKLNAFDSMWARLQNEEPGWPSDPEDRAFHREYLSWMSFHKAITIGELIPLAVQYLRQNPVNDIQTAFDYILIDEYQDLNKADKLLST